MTATATATATSTKAPKAPKASNGAPKVKKERKPRGEALPFDKRIALINFVKDADRSTPDATLAAQASDLVGRVVQQVTIAGYRKKFGIPSVRKPGVKSLYARIAQLEAAIEAAGFEVPA